jgi:ribose transport system ATP-binding protein
VQSGSRFALEARDVTKSFGRVEVLHGVDLDVAGGEVLILLGENGAGKSTLVKVIAGALQPDSGTVDAGDGEKHGSLSPLSARKLGIRMISQEPADALTLTVAENIALGVWPSRRGIVSWSRLRRQAAEILRGLDADIDPAAEVQTLTAGQRQIVEIARAVASSGHCLILDEPTAALSAAEIEQLFTYIGRLRARGAALIYITHRLDELERIGDRVQVLRDGRTVLSGRVADFNRDDLVAAMVGRPAEAVRRPPAQVPVSDATPLLRYAGATSAGAFQDVDLSLYPREIVALYGRLGSGTSAVLEAAFGLRKITAGQLTIDGRPLTPRGPAEAIAKGVGFVPGDRKRDGGFGVRSVAENLCAPSWPRLAKAGLVMTSAREARPYRQWRDVLGIRSTDDPGQAFDTLSGGNQQKVILGRWLERGARVLLLSDPTRGVDVGARNEIYRVLRSLTSQGIGVLVSTSDAEEAYQLSDRTIVMSRGRIAGELEGDEIKIDRLVEQAGV